MNKNLSLFNGSADWLGEKVSVSLQINIGNKESWADAVKVLRALYDNREKRDAEFRAFAAEKLTELANDWQTQENASAEAITKPIFIQRIRLVELSVTSGGSFCAYYRGDDMFLGHAVSVSGSLKKGLTDANIEG